jgi:hypothetical protein
MRAEFIPDLPVGPANANGIIYPANLAGEVELTLVADSGQTVSITGGRPDTVPAKVAEQGNVTRLASAPRIAQSLQRERLRSEVAQVIKMQSSKRGLPRPTTGRATPPQAA